MNNFSGNSAMKFTGERYVPGIDNNQLEMEHYQRYYSVLPLVENKVVIDAACGEGYGSNIISGSAKSVTGLDISSDAVQFARSKYKDKENLCFEVGSVSDLPFEDKSADVIVSFETIEHIPEELQSKFLIEIDRVLKDDGILIMSTPNKAVYSDLHDYHNEFHIKEFYKEEYLEFLHQKFSFVELYDQYFEVVSIIDKAGVEEGNAAYYKSKKYNNEGKYFIAVASRKRKALAGINHIYMNKTAEYESRIQRILELQEEVDERNRHLKLLDTEIENLRLEMESCSEALESVRQEKADLEEENTEYLRRIDKCHSEIDSLKAEKQDLIRENANKSGHILELLEVEREYEREKHSKTYRFAVSLRKISVKLLPINSKRRFFVRLMIRTIRHPLYTIKMINPRRIKNCFIILKSEGTDSAMQHLQLIEEYEKSRDVPLSQENLTIQMISEKEKPIEEYKKLVFPKISKPQISIIIPVYNQFDYTYYCLESILNNSSDCSYEVIVANDNSTDLTKRLNEIADGITIINNEKNLRFLLNCNHAAGYAKGEYLVFLNNDTQVQKNWLVTLVNLMEADQTIGMAGSKLVYADGYLQEAGGIMWRDGSAWNYGHRNHPNDSEFNYVHEVDYISGAAIIIRHSIWKEIGGFDTRFAPAYCEDSDLAFEVRKHGYKVVYQPQSAVVHFEGISNGTDVNSGQKKYQIENQQKFFEKWKEELDQNHFENGSHVFLARDRSRNKKHILVIDHYVPQYDKDAGSKTTFMYLKMLVDKGYCITFLGDNFYQHEPYTSELQQMGILVLYGPKYAEGWQEWLRENLNYFDIIYMNRPHITIKYIDYVREHGRGKIIYYGHDLHFLRLKREYELSGDEKQLQESEEWLRKEFYIMEKADMNYYPSSVECDEIHKIKPSIPVRAITAYVYSEFPQVNYQAENRSGLLFVGGFGHDPNLDAVLWFLDKIYPEVYRELKAPFYIVGSKAPEAIKQITMEGVVVKGFVSEEELQRLYNSCRIAIVPLRYGAGVKGKVVEALYYGIPVITTSVGAEGIPGINDFSVICDTEEELISAIAEVYVNSSQLSEMSLKSQQYVRDKYCTEAVWNVVKNDFA